MGAAGKILGRKAYGSIGHLPESRLGPGDRHVHPGQARLCTERTRDRHERVIVQEKLDGSCCAVARVRGHLWALGRAGHLAQSSPLEQHQLFAVWVRANAWRFAFLEEGERIVGEWLAQAHGTLYHLPHEPFVAFDLMRGAQRAPFEELLRRASPWLTTPRLLHHGGALPLSEARTMIQESGHGAVDPVEGVVYRVERRGYVLCLAKWVRPDKVDGQYLPSVTGGPPIWHWRPGRGRAAALAEPAAGSGS